MDIIVDPICDLSGPPTPSQAASMEVLQLLQQAEALTQRARVTAQRCRLPSSALSHIDILAEVAGECIDGVASPVLDLTLVKAEDELAEDIKAAVAKTVDSTEETKSSLELEESEQPKRRRVGRRMVVRSRNADNDPRDTPALVAALVFFAVVVVPLLIVAICAVFGLVIARCEGWPFGRGFMYFAGNITGLGEPLTRNSPKTQAGGFVDIVVSSWCLIFAGAAIGATAELKVMEQLQDALPLEGARGAVVLLLAVPGVVLAFAFLISLILANCENWSLAVAFRYMISAMCGLGNPLTKRTPQTAIGRLVAIVCASWQMAIGGTIVGLTAAIPSLERGLRRMEARFVAAQKALLG